MSLNMPLKPSAIAYSMMRKAKEKKMAQGGYVEQESLEPRSGGTDNEVEENNEEMCYACGGPVMMAYGGEIGSDPIDEGQTYTNHFEENREADIASDYDKKNRKKFIQTYLAHRQLTDK